VSKKTTQRLTELLMREIPAGIQMSLLPLYEIEKPIREEFSDVAKGELTRSVLDLASIDPDLFTQGLNEKEKAYFINLLALEITNQKDYATASALIVLFRKFLVPMAERKQALEKMIIALGGEKNAQGQTEEN